MYVDAEYADSLDKPIIRVRVDADYPPPGCLGILRANISCCEFRTENFDQDWTRLYFQLFDLLPSGCE